MLKSKHSLEIVHGIGEGVLKSEVHKLLKLYNLTFFLTISGFWINRGIIITSIYSLYLLILILLFNDLFVVNPFIEVFSYFDLINKLQV